MSVTEKTGPALVYLRDRQWLLREYVENERSTKAIARQLGCDKNTVRDWLRRYGVATRDCGEDTRLHYATRGHQDARARPIRQMVTGTGYSRIEHLAAGDRAGRVGR